MALNNIPNNIMRYVDLESKKVMYHKLKEASNRMRISYYNNLDQRTLGGNINTNQSPGN